MVVGHACGPSYSGCWGGRLAWAWPGWGCSELLYYSLDDRVRPCLKNKTKEKQTPKTKTKKLKKGKCQLKINYYIVKKIKEEMKISLNFSTLLQLTAFHILKYMLHIHVLVWYHFPLSLFCSTYLLKNDLIWNPMVCYLAYHMLYTLFTILYVHVIYHTIPCIYIINTLLCHYIVFSHMIYNYYLVFNWLCIMFYLANYLLSDIEPVSNFSYYEYGRPEFP